MPICPECHVSNSTWPTSGRFSVCPNCARTLVTDGTPRIATAVDTTALPTAYLAELRQLRGRVVKSMGWPDTGAE